MAHAGRFRRAAALRFHAIRKRRQRRDLFPAPKRLDEADGVVAGYDAKVIFPIRVVARDKSAPVKLDLQLDYAACDRICLPARARLALTLPKGGASPFASDVAEALARVPRRLSEKESASMLNVRPVKDEPRRWLATYLGEGVATQMFPEAPDPLFLEAAPGTQRNSFEIKLEANGGAVPAAGVVARITLVTDRGAFETTTTLK